MILDPGTKLGPYEILEPLGAGGMGEVYKARDTRLNRAVAVKVSRAQFSERFEREARTIAALSHPHICALYDVGPNYLVMELLEGRNLAQRIASGPIPVSEAVAIARQIAEALEAAHEKGIVHRDLKPANINIASEDSIKVLDFGLAKTAESSASASGDGTNSPTLTISPTSVGTILGTAAYMAPEQARGATVDERADIWAFGVVLYEMLTGKPMFTGDSVSDVVAAVLRSEPDWNALPPDTPASVRRLLRRCLCKDRKKRLRDIGDALLELDEAPEAVAAQTARRSPVLWVVAGALATGLLVEAWFGLRPSPVQLPQPVSRWTTILPSPTLTDVALSRDGTLLVFAGLTSGAQSLTLRAMDRQELRRLPATGGALGPVFSPDGRWIAFYVGEKLAKVAVAGGSPITICQTASQRGRTWGDDNTIVFGTVDGGLMQVPAAGGTPKPLTTPDHGKGELSHQWPWFLPDARAVLFTIITSGPPDASQIAVLDRKSGSYRVIVNGATNGRYSPSGHLIFARAGELYAAPFDASRLEVTGQEVPVIKDSASTNITGVRYALSDSGLLVYLGQGQGSRDRTLEWVDRQGNRRPSGLPARLYGDISLSPNGRRVAVSIADSSSGAGPRALDIWVGELERGTLTRLTSGDWNVSPVWTLDGRQVTFSSYTFGGWVLKQLAADGSGTPEELVKGNNQLYPLSRTSGAVLYRSSELGPARIFLLPAPVGGVKSKPRQLMDGALGEAEGDAQLSPDGRWIAYASNESGRFEVYVRSFPALGAKVPISSLGGENPHWTGNGRELVYRDPVKDQLMAVEVQTTPEFRAERARPLFTLDSPGALSVNFSLYRGWDVTPDGKRFLVINAPESAETGVKLQAVVNWFEELRRLVPAGK